MKLNIRNSAYKFLCNEKSQKERRLDWLLYGNTNATHVNYDSRIFLFEFSNVSLHLKNNYQPLHNSLQALIQDAPTSKKSERPY